MNRQLIRLIWIVTGVALLSACGPNTRDQVTSRFRSKEFTALHALALQQPFGNIAVLPRSRFIVIDKTVINAKSHTFGDEPVIGFYEDYYKSGSAQQFDSLEDLLMQRNVLITGQTLNEMVRRMKMLGIGDILKDQESDMIIYSWDMSAMWGADGIVYSPSGDISQSGRKALGRIQRLSKKFFLWDTD